MCIAIVKPQGKTISDEILTNCFENNPDGAGLAYACNGELYYVKGIFDVKSFIAAVREAEKHAQGDMLIHCRIGTSGLKDKNNCHPHIVNERTVMIHNGILDVAVPKNSKVSDTVIYIDQYLKNLPIDFMKNKAILKLIEENIGNYNKFAFLNNKGESAIVNKQAGTVDNGIWYSNTTYKTERIPWGNCYNWWDKEDEFSSKHYKADAFDDPCCSHEEIYDYFESYINGLIEQDFYFLDEYPLIDKNNYNLIPYNAEKEADYDNYISLEEYSPYLYDLYMDKYDILTSEEKDWKEAC